MDTRGSGNSTRANRVLLAKLQALENIVTAQGRQLDMLFAEKGSVEAEVAKTKTLDELKVTELKALALENGIDDTDFGNKKAPYIKALKTKGLE